MKKILLLPIIIAIFSCSVNRDLEIEQRLKSEVSEKNKNIITLNKKIDELIIKNSDMKSRVAELSVMDTNGLAVEEKRKSLVDKEAFLNERENDLSDRSVQIAELEKSLRKQEKETTVSQKQFLEEKQSLIEKIGAAKQLEAENKNLRNSLKKSSSFLFTLFIITVVMLISLLVFIILAVSKHSHLKSIVEVIQSTSSIPREDKNLMFRVLGKEKLLSETDDEPISSDDISDENSNFFDN